jgi:hypothetical protein
MTPVQVALSADQARAAFRLFHPKGNIVTAEMIAALTQALDSLTDSPHLKLVTIEGQGEDFSFGASIPEHAPGEIERVLPRMHELIYALLDFPAPTATLAISFSPSGPPCSDYRKSRWGSFRRRPQPCCRFGSARPARPARC